MTLDQLEVLCGNARAQVTFTDIGNIDPRREFIAACSPDYILKLIRVARAARMYASSPDELETALKALTPETGNE